MKIEELEEIIKQYKQKRNDCNAYQMLVEHNLKSTIRSKFENVFPSMCILKDEEGALWQKVGINIYNNFSLDSFVEVYFIRLDISELKLSPKQKAMYKHMLRAQEDCNNLAPFLSSYAYPFELGEARRQCIKTLEWNYSIDGISHMRPFCTGYTIYKDMESYNKNKEYIPRYDN